MSFRGVSNFAPTSTPWGTFQPGYHKSPLSQVASNTAVCHEEHRIDHGELDMTPSYRFNAENVVTLLVGPEQVKMIVHAGFLARTSDFFATALKQVWIEGQTRTITLHEESPELMAHYLDWVYSSELSTKDCSKLHQESAKIAAHDLLAELYVFGERRLDSSFRNAITAEFIRLRLILHSATDCQPSQRVKTINTIYQGTPAGSPVRRLMVDLGLRYGCAQCYTGDLDKGFIVVLTHAFFVAVQGPKGVGGQRGIEPRAEDYCV